MTTAFDRLKSHCAEDWRAYCQHDFVRQIAEGTLSEAAFRHYLQQDYLFLVHFARAWGLAVYKSRDIFELRQSLESLKAIVDVELGLHIDYCGKWRITERELRELPEERATLAYTRYVLDTGNRGDLLDLHVALAPCLIGYGEIANWIMAQPSTVLDGNPYAEWIAMYSSDEFQSAMKAELDWLNPRLEEAGQRRFKELALAFRDATRLEIDFWQMGLNAAEHGADTRIAGLCG